MQVGPPSYTSNQWGHHHPSAYQTGRDNTDRQTLLPQTPNYGSTPIPVRQKTSSQSMTLLSFIIGASMFILIIISLTTSLYPSMARESSRREWEAELRRHQIVRDAWNSERNAMAVEREAWRKERANHRLEREDLAAEKERWRKERADYENREREDLAAEKERWRKERADYENREREEEEAKRALILWQDLRPSSRCLRYGTREYSATLGHVPIGLDPLKECWNKSIDIHGRQVLPSRCDTQGACGAVVGHWIIDFNEATCVTWWRGYDDKGCVEQGIHRYESILENLQNGDDWHEMCATTPGHVQGRDFAGPTSCASWRSGINAIWLIEDGNCN